jgi:hypothetical protein
VSENGNGDDKNEKGHPLSDLKEAFNKQITSNDSDTSEFIPPFTTGDGDSSDDESDSDTSDDA